MQMHLCGNELSIDYPPQEIFDHIFDLWENYTWVKSESSAAEKEDILKEMEGIYDKHPLVFDAYCIAADLLNSPKQQSAKHRILTRGVAAFEKHLPPGFSWENATINYYDNPNRPIHRLFFRYVESLEQDSHYWLAQVWAARLYNAYPQNPIRFDEILFRLAPLTHDWSDVYRFKDEEDGDQITFYGPIIAALAMNKPANTIKALLQRAVDAEPAIARNLIGQGNGYQDFCQQIRHRWQSEMMQSLTHDALTQIAHP